MAPKRILYHLVAPLDLTMGPQEIQRRQNFLSQFTEPGNRIVVRAPEAGRESIAGDWDAALVAPHVIDGLRTAQADGFDAGIIGCFSDPGHDAAREAVDMPVIGPGAAAVHLALQLGDLFAVIAPGEGAAGRTRAHMRALGVDDRLTAARGVGLSVEELARADESAFDQIAQTAQKCREDGADVLILGCMSMAFLDPTPQLVARLGIPVVNPVIAALKTAEMICRHQLTHSRSRWPAAADRPVHARTQKQEKWTEFTSLREASS